MEATSIPDPDLDLDNILLDFPVEGEADPAWLDSLLNDAFDFEFGEDQFQSPSGDSFTGSGSDSVDKEEEEEKEKEEENALPVSSSSSSATSTTTGINFHNLTYSDGKDDEEKRKARLMRNRESAQLSRQRKKNYIDELEEKVKCANSTIAELNNTVAYLSAENVKLKQQLGAFNPSANPLPCYPSWPPPFPYPAYPPAVAVAGGGLRVPLLPIPRLKSSPPSSKPRKQPTSKIRHHHDHDHEKPSKKIKKVASVAFLGFFFFVLFLVGGTGTFRANITQLSPDGSLFNGGGRVFTSWDGNNSTVNNIKDVNNNNYDFERAKEEIDNCGYPQNVSQPLAAALFVPRNEKLVKINGNLIIHAVLAGEKALKANKEDIVSTKQESEKNSLAIITERHRALAAARASDQNLDIQSHLFEGATENQRALASNPANNYREDMKPTTVDGSLQQWFREGLAGPVMNSGMCTEVFQFDASFNSPVTTRNSRFVASVSSNGANGSVEHSRNNSSGSKMNEAHRSGPVKILKNRRVSYAVPLPPASPPLNVRNERNLTDHTERIHEDRGYQRNSTIPSSMVVSVLVDPLETGDEGMLSSGSLSRIFVVVLIDRVKYVTYSCVLPSKGSVPYLAS